MLSPFYFIPAQYRKSNFESVKEALLQAEVYVYAEDKEIKKCDKQ